MSLNWQFENKEVFAKMSDKDKELNNVFIWGMMIVDMREITEKNAEEWQWRYAYASKLNGPYQYIDDKPYVPTLEEVKKRIGLRCNVSERTRNQFIAKEARIFSQENK